MFWDIAFPNRLYPMDTYGYMARQDDPKEKGVTAFVL